MASAEARTHFARADRAIEAALDAAVLTISDIERDVEHRRKLVDELERSATRHERIVRLNKEEVEAVAQELQLVVGREGRRSVWITVLVGLASTVLGVVLGRVF